MKYLSLVLISLFYLTLHAQNFVTPEKTWLITQCYADSSGGGGGVQCTDYEYRFADAIEIDGQEYLTLITDNNSGLYYHTYYREEEGRVYARNDEDLEEFLLYDFNLEVGDMITAGDPNASTFSSTDFIVVDVEFIPLEDGTMTKQIKVQNPLGAIFSWIEGVGGTNNTFAPGTEWEDDYSWHWFKCTLSNDVLFYTESNSCSFVSTEELVDEDLQIYPNPSSGIFNISTVNSDAINARTIRIYTIAGRLIKTVNMENEFVSIDLSSNYTGVYLIELSIDNRRFYEKLIKD